MAVGVIKKKNFSIIAMSPVGEGLSGGDRIFIELSRNFGRMGVDVQIITWEDGVKMIERQRLDKVSSIKYQVLSIKPWCRMGFVICYFARIVRSTIWAFSSDPILNFVYSASDFWMDVFPAFILKLKNRKIKWIASWYQTAPHPFSGFASPLYWLSQLISKPLIKRFADFVIVNNEDERKQFPMLNKQDKVFAMLGAVDVEKIGDWKRKIRKLPKKYDAVFQGRLHPQKGILELIDIWRKVVDKRSGARLVMIGDGPLMESAKFKVQSLKLGNNILFKGYLFDGDEKYKIFAQSKIVVHPALYDSGGMASGEAMAFGLPCVGFSLKSYQSYYPQGMIKVKTGDLDAFAEAILKILDDEKYRTAIGREAKKMIEKNWSWEKRTQKLLAVIGKNYV